MWQTIYLLERGAADARIDASSGSKAVNSLIKRVRDDIMAVSYGPRNWRTDVSQCMHLRMGDRCCLSAMQDAQGLCVKLKWWPCLESPSIRHATL